MSPRYVRASSRMSATGSSNGHPGVAGAAKRLSVVAGSQSCLLYAGCSTRPEGWPVAVLGDSRQADRRSGQGLFDAPTRKRRTPPSSLATMARHVLRGGQVRADARAGTMAAPTRETPPCGSSRRAGQATPPPERHTQRSRVQRRSPPSPSLGRGTTVPVARAVSVPARPLVRLPRVRCATGQGTVRARVGPRAAPVSSAEASALG